MVIAAHRSRVSESESDLSAYTTLINNNRLKPIISFTVFFTLYQLVKAREYRGALNTPHYTGRVLALMLPNVGVFYAVTYGLPVY